jgi:hypothetical protein
MGKTARARSAGTDAYLQTPPAGTTSGVGRSLSPVSSHESSPLLPLLLASPTWATWPDLGDLVAPSPAFYPWSPLCVAAFYRPWSSPYARCLPAPASFCFGRCVWCLYFDPGPVRCTPHGGVSLSALGKYPYACILKMSQNLQPLFPFSFIVPYLVAHNNILPPI